ncbi:HNH endonuclease signature motif containing protein, partial [Mesorhizobium sp.]|uniref:HNH endonuclease signature motif containing protein n=1 Tax=Mesorhizobium sp. TaxID=1871066 RepID=UPI00257E13CC
KRSRHFTIDSSITGRALEPALRGGTATAQAFIDSLVDFSTNVDQLPLLASAPDLQNPEIRKAVWDLTRDATPIIKHRISRYVERGPIGAMVKLTNNHRCQGCDVLGQAWAAFFKPDGMPYVEAHHVVQVSTLSVDVLGPQNVITVCPNHHRQLHFEVTTVLHLGDEFEFILPPHLAFRIRKFSV